MKKTVDKKTSKKTDKKKSTLNKKIIPAKIVDVDCNVKIGKNALLIEYKNITYVTSKDLTQKLINGELKIKTGTKTRRKGSVSKSLRLNILRDGKIINTSEDKSVFLTKKEKSFYVAIDEELLITPVSGVQKLLSGEWRYVKMGLIK